jgi:hypothetical protein
MRNDWTMEQTHNQGSADQLSGPGRAIPAPDAAGHGETAEERAMPAAIESWKIEVLADDSGEWESDPLRFETMDEALAYARDLELRWSAVRDRRVVASADPVNHHWPQPRKRAGDGRLG